MHHFGLKGESVGETNKPLRQNIPSRPGTPVTPTSENIREYIIELITPLFGGGASTRVNDTDFPIRPTAIRGQLQFWWRATVGAQYPDKDALRSAQSAVWGDTTRASPVRIRVDVDVESVSTPVPCARYELDNKNPGKFRSRPSWNTPFDSNDSALPYALFPFQGQLDSERSSIEVKPAEYINKPKFRLTISWTKEVDFAKQVEPAIWAWVNFGGLGSRTRRGCGAIYCKELAPQNLASLDKWYRDRIPANRHEIREWPTMPTQILYSQNLDDPLAQWNHVIRLLKDFRQKAGKGLGYARPLGPGRSWYPEPDTIRRIMNRHSHGHDPYKHLSGNRPLPDGFPRAELGLPIVFKFINDNKGEPSQTTLHPYLEDRQNDSVTTDSSDIRSTAGEIKDRMASPLILRPLGISNDLAVSIVVVLQTPGVQKVALLDKNGEDLCPRHSVPVQDSKFVEYPDSPIRGLTKKGSALEAFLNFAVQTAAMNKQNSNSGFRSVPL